MSCKNSVVQPLSMLKIQELSGATPPGPHQLSASGHRGLVWGPHIVGLGGLPGS